MDFISSDQALELLKSNPENYTTPDSIRGLISRVDMNTPGEITILYSGSYTDGGIPTSANHIAQAMARNGDDIRIINNTEVAILLERPEFVAAAGKAWGFTDVIEIKDAYNDRSSSFNQFFFAAEDGLWADASKRFVAETVGEVRTLTAYAEHGRTFDLVELPGVLRNPNITYIDGVDNSLLQNHYNTLLANGNNNDVARGAIFDAVTARSYDASASLHYNVANVDGKPVTYIDSRDYFAPYGVEGHVNDGNIIYKPLPLAPPSEAHMAGRATNQGISESISRELKLMDASLDMAKYAKSMNNLNRMGMVGDIIGLSMVLNEANAAYQIGNVEKAQLLLSDWLTALGGGIVSAGVALEALSPVLGAIAAAGPAGPVISGALSLIIGIAAGFFGSEFSLEMAHWLDTLFDTASTHSDPLVLDLDGDGIETTASSSTLLFDFDGDGVKTSTGWVGPDDALLVLDRNGDGKINNGQELFGDDTILRDGTLAQNGFAALRDLDSNLDGQFDARDEQFSQVRLWQDSNRDGIAQSDELKSLTDYGIRSLDLTSKSANSKNNGNVISQTGNFTRDDGTTGKFAELDFATNPFYQEFADDAITPMQATGLADLQGTGAVRDLHAAMELNPELTTLLLRYSATETAYGQFSQIDALLAAWGATSLYPSFEQRLAAESTASTKIQFVWSWQIPGQTREPTPAERETQALLTKIGLLEAFNGQNFFAISHTEYKGKITLKLALSNSGFILKTKTWSLTEAPQELLFTEADFTLPAENIKWAEQAYNTLRQMTYQGLAGQTRLQEYFSGIGISFEGSGAALDYSRLLAMLQAKLKVNPVDAFMDAQSLQFYWTDDAWEAALQSTKLESIKQMTGDQLQFIEKMLISLNKSVIAGTTGNDTLTGKNATDLLSGGAGNDRLDGHAGHDILNGGTGNDLLTGGDNAADTYLFAAGHGQDTVNDSAGEDSEADTLRFTGARAASARFSKQGNSLLIQAYGAEDSVTLTTFFGSDSHRKFHFAFDDVTLGLADIEAMSMGSNGTAGNDTLTGWVNADTLDGGAGNDRLDGYAGHDILNGGTGNDLLNGGDNAADTYLFAAGHGQDTVKDSASKDSEADTLRFTGARAGSTRFSKQGNNLLIQAYGAEDSVTITSFFGSDSYRHFHFAFDDVTLGLADIEAMSMGSNGTAGNDTLTGWANADTLDGGAGNDRLDGYAGHDILNGGTGNDLLMGGDNAADTYLFAAGHGQDTVKDSASKDSEADTLRFTGARAADARFSKRGSHLLIQAYGAEDSVTLTSFFGSDSYRHFHFAFDDITLSLADIEAMSMGSNGTSGNDSLGGWEASDTLTGGAGNDRLDGYAGHDILDGGTGNDMLNGGNYAADTYLFAAGHGQDTVNDYASKDSEADTLRFTGARAADARFSKRGSHLLIQAYGAEDSVTLTNFFGSDSYRHFHFAFDDVTLSLADIETMSMESNGTAGDDSLGGWEASDTLTGGAGNDRLDGYAGHDILDGGTGNDMLNGGAGSDIYLFAKGHNQDTINDLLVNAGDTDAIKFTEAKIEDLWFSRKNNNLLIREIGSDDSVTLNNWYYGAAYQNKVISVADGQYVTNVQVQQLVEAMAAFGEPSASGTIMNQTQPLWTQLVPTSHEPV